MTDREETERSGHWWSDGFGFAHPVGLEVGSSGQLECISTP